MDRKSIKPFEDLIDGVRNIDGFPIANDEDIIRLSDPPFYTACPNPYINYFIDKYCNEYDSKNDIYYKTPFIGDISEGKTDPLYNAHTYHTKVPYKAIVKFIEYYTSPGDIILDTFCGSGMTGIAAQKTNRKAILVDLSPSATFLTYNFNRKLFKNKFKEEAVKILNKGEKDLSWMYETHHDNKKNRKNQILIDGSYNKGKINYTVWSDIDVCPYCKNEYIFWNVAVNEENHKVKKEYECPNCKAELKTNDRKSAKFEIYDPILRKEIRTVKKVPVLINYFVGKERYEKKPDDNDIKIIEKINNLEIPYWYPSEKIMFKGENWGDTWRKGVHFGITHTHHFYTKRNLWILSYINHLIEKISEKRISNMLKVLLQSFLFHTSILNRKVPGGIGRHLSGTLYVPSLSCEVSVFEMYNRKLKDFLKSFFDFENNIISTSSATSLSNIIKPISVDYVFVDPPFGSNLMYSELSFIWESWIKVFTNVKKEAIINKSQNKDLYEYTILMEKCFKQIFIVLKPNRWMTVIFHNSQASVWNSIQEAITRAGFIIAQVSVLDKKQGSFKQVVYSGTVKNDLIINAYKPKEQFSNKLLKNAGEDMELEFVLEHLKHLPVRPNIERAENMLFSKLLAHYVENGFKIKYNASTFYDLLSQNLVEIDGYWFIDSQIKKYNEWKKSLSLDQMKNIIDGQQILFVNDEKSALTWLNNFLNTLRSFSEISTAYNQILTNPTDTIPELKDLLNNNFINENDKYRRPMTVKEKQTINKNRMSELKRAYNNILSSIKEKKGKIKNIRKEALLYGFKECYNQGNYEDILIIAEKLHKNIIESSGALMDFIDIAKLKINN